MNSRKHRPESFEALPFKDLKKNLETRRRKKKEAPAVKKQKAPDDGELFDKAMREVREIREYREMPLYSRKTARKFKITSSDSEALKALEEIINGKRPLNLPDTSEYVEWVNRDYREDIIKKLHEGQYAVQDCLDLHGISVEEADL